MGELKTLGKLEYIHFAIQESINGNNDELENALKILEDIREPHLKKLKISEVIHNG